MRCAEKIGGYVGTAQTMLINAWRSLSREHSPQGKLSTTAWSEGLSVCLSALPPQSLYNRPMSRVTMIARMRQCVGPTAWLSITKIDLVPSTADGPLCLQQRPGSYLSSIDCTGPVPLWREQQFELLGSMCVCSVAQPHPTLCGPMNCSSSDSSVHGIF